MVDLWLAQPIEVLAPMVVELVAMHWEQVVVHHWQLEQLQDQSKSHIKELESGCSACSSMTPLELRLSQISFRPQQKDLRRSKGWDYSRCPGGDSQLRKDGRWLVVDQLGLAPPNQRVGLLADTAEWVHCHWLGRLDVVVTLPKDHLSAQLREVVGVTTSAGSRPVLRGGGDRRAFSGSSVSSSYLVHRRFPLQ